MRTRFVQGKKQMAVSNSKPCQFRFDVAALGQSQEQGTSGQGLIMALQTCLPGPWNSPRSHPPPWLCFAAGWILELSCLSPAQMEDKRRVCRN